jgi:hypothetical protein
MALFVHPSKHQTPALLPDPLKGKPAHTLMIVRWLLLRQPADRGVCRGDLLTILSEK